MTGSFHTGDGTWQTLTLTALPAISGELQCQISTQAAGTYEVDSAMLVLGSVPGDYASLHPADDVARCRRYYEKLGGANQAFWSQGYANAGSFAVGGFHTFCMTKGGTPSNTKVGTWTKTNCGEPVVDTAMPEGFRLYALSSATGPTSYQCADATTYITSEWNPS